MANWTIEQQKVIDTRDKNILVSAAAGSGKTAVLVERIIKKIIDKENPLDVSKLLVATFTNAAAAEMRERILKAIENELVKDPENINLQKQLANVHEANITTIHGFCLKLVKEHFNDVDLDPSVKVADEGEISLLRSDVVKEVLEEFYSQGKESFIDFVTEFENKNDDSYIEEMILLLYNKSMRYPWPEMWLDSCVEKYSITTEKELLDSDYVKLINDYADGILTENINQYNLMINMCNNGGPQIYIDTFTNEREEISRILQEKNFDRRSTKLNMNFGRLPNCKKDSCDMELKESVCESRKDIKSSISKLKEKFYFQSAREVVEEIVKCKPIIETYVELTKKFIERFKEKKLDKNIIDFNDFEHYAIDILVKNENGKVVPTVVADELAEEFAEVMIDEYQDSNIVQETILASLSKERHNIFNRFMVGDVKQSIYGFRGANPEIFIDKYNSYIKDGSKPSGYKIVLDKNFRSRKGVIDTTNFIFRQIMNEKLGGINYDVENQLNFGAIFKECQKPEYESRIDDETELILVNPDEVNEESGISENEEIEIYGNEEDINVTSKELEARAIASRIKELVDKEKGMVVFDKNINDYRPAKYSDIVVLLRSISGIGDIINDELMRCGVPCHMESKTGYFDTIEIRTIISYLKIIDNPMQDIPLAAVLKSPIVNLKDEELVLIRLAGGKKLSLYENIQLYINRDENEIDYYSCSNKISYDEKLRKKLIIFHDLLKEYRVKTTYMSIYELLCDVLEKTNYSNYVTAMPSGVRRKANIEMLKNKAEAYENGTYKGLFNFIRYVEKLNKYEVEMGEASIISETDDAVRIMTIHKSKGLEFPIVVIANMGKKFNSSDTRKKITTHSEMGIGMDYIDKETRLKTKNIIKSCINTKIMLETIEEEMRLFYVACTRAKEKLIFTANSVDEKKLKKMTSKRMLNEEYLGYGTISQCSSFLDFVVYGLGRNKSFDEIYKKYLDVDIPYENMQHSVESNIKVNYIGINQIFKGAIKEKVNEISNVNTLKNLPTEIVFSDNIRKKLEKRIKYIYPYEKEVISNSKMSVSEIKKISYEIEQNDIISAEEFIKSIDETENNKKTTVPSFICAGKKLNGAARGTAYHSVFEHFDFNVEPSVENIHKMLEKMVITGALSEEERESIHINDIVNFANSSLGQRMKAASSRGDLFREAQFVIGISESKVSEFKRIAEIAGRDRKLLPPQDVKDEGDIILIQGIIDVYFIEKGKIILADYKTDNVNDMKDLVEHYYVQLELYKMAVEQITQIEVSEKIIYSVKFSEEINS